MAQYTISRRQARRFLLFHQDLLPPRRLSGKPGILKFFKRVGSIQFDPLNITGNNPQLVLQARVADFRPQLLDELLYSDRKLIDGWDKMASIYRTEDRPYFRRYHEVNRKRLGHKTRPAAAVVDDVRRMIEEDGPLSSLDIDLDKTVDWSWAPTRLARAALDSMYMWGELVIHHRVHTRKIYDLAERHLPQAVVDAPEPHPDDDVYTDFRVLRRIGSIGLMPGRAGDGWLGIPGLKADVRKTSLRRLKEKAAVTELSVEGTAYPFYARGSDWRRFTRSGNGNAAGSGSREAAFIAPLDNLLWDRRMIRALFGFDYRWEVYKPRAERKYGYYVLPVLYSDEFVGRCEPVFDKESGRLCIRNWWWEDGVDGKDTTLLAAVAAALGAFCDYLGAGGYIISDAAAGAGLAL